MIAALIVILVVVFLYYVFIGYKNADKRNDIVVERLEYTDRVTEYNVKIELQDFTFSCQEQRLPFLQHTINGLNFLLASVEKTGKIKDLLFQKEKAFEFCSLLKQDFPKNNQVCKKIEDMLVIFFIKEAKRVMQIELDAVSTKSKYATTKSGKLNPLSKFLEGLKNYNFAYSDKALEDIERFILKKQQRVEVEDLIERCRLAEIKEKNIEDAYNNLIYFIEHKAFEEIKSEYSWFIKKSENFL